MTLLPVVHRELLVRARQPNTHGERDVQLLCRFHKFPQNRKGRHSRVNGREI